MQQPGTAVNLSELIAVFNNAFPHHLQANGFHSLLNQSN